MVELMRDNNSPMLLLDCGGFFGKPQKELKLKADVTIRAMKIMGYDAVNLGADDLQLGLDYLKEMHSQNGIPFISSNTIAVKNDISWLKTHVIINVSGTKIAILGIMPPGSLESQSGRETKELIKVLEPASALKKLLPSIKKQSDVIILLSQLDGKKTDELAKSLKDINLIIACNKKLGEADNPEISASITGCSAKGKDLQNIPLTIAGAGKITVGDTERITLDDSIPTHEQVVALIDKDYRARMEEIRETRRKKIQEKQKKLHEEQMKTLELTPEEFFQQLKETQKMKEEK